MVDEDVDDDPPAAPWADRCTGRATEAGSPAVTVGSAVGSSAAVLYCEGSSRSPTVCAFNASSLFVAPRTSNRSLS